MGAAGAKSASIKNGRIGRYVVTATVGGLGHGEGAGLVVDLDALVAGTKFPIPIVGLDDGGADRHALVPAAKLHGLPEAKGGETQEDHGGTDRPQKPFFLNH